MGEPIPVFITSRNRGLYLWACLDSLFKYTRHPALFIIGDNASDEPLVRQVIEGFQRRGFLHRVFLREKNEPDLMEFLLRENRDLLGSCFASIESNVMVLPQEPCWLTRLAAIMEQNPKLAMLGSFLDKSDFIELDRARQLLPGATPEQLAFLTKAQSPERTLEPTGEDWISLPAPQWPHNPPGRLLIRRVEPVENLFQFNVRHLNDGTWHQELVKAGYQTGVAMNVPHRHLSLANAFDYPAYDQRARDWFFLQRKNEYRKEIEAAAKSAAVPAPAPPPAKKKSWFGAGR